jgi:hypothetical protein
MKNVLIVDNSEKGKLWIPIQDSLEFECSGAIDFSESIKIELSKEEKDGFEKIHPYDLYCKLYFPHLDCLIRHNLWTLIQYSPHISDMNLKKEDIIYYRCYRVFHHSHWPYDKKEIKYLSFDEAKKMIKKEKLSLVVL